VAPGAWLILAACAALPLDAQQPLTWQQVRAKFESANPTLRAGQLNIDEARAQETTAFLRPNPSFSATLDQLEPFTTNPYRPLGSALPLISTSYLHERGHKRELRLESARRSTAVTASQQDDLRRTLLFSLRSAFVTALQYKATLEVARDNLAYYDRFLALGRERLKAGDIAQVDMMRLELQRVQLEADVRTAEVNVRTAKIQLLTLMNDRMAVEQFDVTGTFDFAETTMPLEEFRQLALAARPDLKASLQTVQKAEAEHNLAIANGSTDPVFSLDAGHNPPISVYLGFSVNIPLRIFDRNQGEKERTAIDIRRTQRLREAAEAQVFSDVDSSWASLNNSLTLLRPYKTKYLDEAAKVRDTIAFAYQRGGASLLDFLGAENDYRSIRLNYLNLVGSYLTAASQLNLAVGREVIP
jgi:cobalt-zinc-cadmium efflux system outer membrane protein